MSLLQRTAMAVLVCLVLAAMGFVAGFQARGLAQSTSESYPLVGQAHLLLSEHFLDPLPEAEVLERGMIRGLLQELHDPFTVYVEPAAHELETATLAGEYIGIGALLARDEQGRTRLVPMADGPAARAGVAEGDVLLAVDGKPISSGDSLDSIGLMLRGPESSTVHLRLAGRSPGEEDLLISVIRERIPLPSVTAYLHPDDPTIGILVITNFSGRTPEELNEAFHSLAERHAAGYVIDLRGNPGGLLDSAVEVAAYFLESGVVTIERGRAGVEVTHAVETPGQAADVPLAILVDAGTASAAEIVAAALQSNGRAPLVGTTTLGKGSVQLIFELRDGSSLHVTAFRWLTPGGQPLDGVGLEPDLRVDPGQADGGSDPILQAAVAWLRGHGEGAP